MAHAVMNKFKSESMKGNVDAESDPLYMALVGDIFSVSSVDQMSDIDYWSDISASWEISGTGYSANGQQMQNVGITENDVDNRAIMSASDVSWSNSTLSSYGAAIYRSTDNLLVTLLDFGGVRSSTSAPFTVAAGPNGFLVLS